MMRGILIAAAALSLLTVAPASAQRGDAFEGTWAFQTASYGNEQVGGIMSGAAWLSVQSSLLGHRSGK